MMTHGWAAYYRTSTRRQTLGLDAQRAAVTEFTKGAPLLAEFEEQESAKGAGSRRPQLMAALAFCKKHKCKLVIAKLDRLARNVAFVSTLMESKVKFTCADNPEANNLTIHILAAVAEHEAKIISQRTRDGLMATRAKGTTLGKFMKRQAHNDDGTIKDPSGAAAMGRATLRNNADQFAANVLPIVAEIQQLGTTTVRGIAERLNARNVPTARGTSWQPETVARLLRKKRAAQ